MFSRPYDHKHSTRRNSPAAYSLTSQTKKSKGVNSNIMNFNHVSNCTKNTSTVCSFHLRFVYYNPTQMGMIVGKRGAGMQICSN